MGNGVLPSMPAMVAGIIVIPICNGSFVNMKSVACGPSVVMACHTMPEMKRMMRCTVNSRNMVNSLNGKMGLRAIVKS